MIEPENEIIDPMYSAFLRGELDDHFEEGWYEITLGVPDLAA